MNIKNGKINGFGGSIPVHKMHAVTKTSKTFEQLFILSQAI